MRYQDTSDYHQIRQPALNISILHLSLFTYNATTCQPFDPQDLDLPYTNSLLNQSYLSCLSLSIRTQFLRYLFFILSSSAEIRTSLYEIRTNCHDILTKCLRRYFSNATLLAIPDSLTLTHCLLRLPYPCELHHLIPMPKRLTKS